MTSDVVSPAHADDEFDPGTFKIAENVYKTQSKLSVPDFFNFWANMLDPYYFKFIINAATKEIKSLKYKQKWDSEYPDLTPEEEEEQKRYVKMLFWSIFSISKDVINDISSNNMRGEVERLIDELYDKNSFYCDEIYETVSSILINNTAVLFNGMEVQYTKNDTPPLNILLSVLFLPMLTYDDQIFETLLDPYITNRKGEKIDMLIDTNYFLPLINYLLLFRSPSIEILDKLIDRVQDIYFSNPTFTSQFLLSMLKAEKEIPYSTAILSLYDSVNSDFPHLLFCSGTIKNSMSQIRAFPFEMKTKIYHLLCVLYSAHYKEERHADVNNIEFYFSKLIGIVNQLFLDEEYDADMFWEDGNFVSFPVHDEEPIKYSPPLLNVKTIKTSHECKMKNSSDNSGNPFLLPSGMDNVFESLKVAELDNVTFNRTRPNLISIAICDQKEFLNVLISFVHYITNQQSIAFGQNPSFIVIPTTNYRLGSFLETRDAWIGSTAQYFGSLFENMFPDIDRELLNPEISQIPLIIKPRNYDSFRQMESPYHVILRYLTFLTTCTHLTTSFPIWCIELYEKMGSTCKVPFIDSVFVGRAFCPKKIRTSLSLNVNGKIKFQVISTDTHNIGNEEISYEENFSMSLINFSYDEEQSYHSIEENILTLSIPDISEERSLKPNQYLVNNIEFDSEDPFNLFIDSVNFENIVRFKIYRFIHPNTGEGLYFPIRHFFPLEQI